MCPGACVIIKSAFEDNAPRIAVTPVQGQIRYKISWAVRTTSPKHRHISFLGLNGITKVRFVNVINANGGGISDMNWWSVSCATLIRDAYCLLNEVLWYWSVTDD